MKAKILLLSTFLFSVTAAGYAQRKTSPQAQNDEASIRKVMANQTDAWNKGNLTTFMKGYWNNDSLVFIGRSGPSYGYRQALANYRKNYSGPDQMGKLFFDLLKVKRLSADYYFVIGKWFLKRKAGDIGGTYTLLFHKIDGQWRIVVDHTS